MLRAKLQEDQLQALKTSDRARLETLRYVLSRVKNQEIEKKSDLDDRETVDVLRKIRRELVESIESFDKGARTDLASQSREQLKVVESYLPQEMSDAQLNKAIEEIKAKNTALIEANPKALIGMCIRELKDKVDSQRIVKVVQSLS